ncbi:MAG: endo-1,4-beta-xylanase, partial [Anaerolineae bacterium]
SKRNWRTRLSLFVVLAYLIGLLSPSMALAEPVVVQPLVPQATVVAEYDFEDGEQGWWGRGTGVTVTSVTTVAHTGTHSLQVEGRTEGWNGPAINALSLLEVGATYEISGCVRLVAGTPVTRTNFGIEYKPVGGSTSWHWLGVEDNTTDADWACMSGTFEYTEEAETLTLYAESASTTASFYIDDVTIMMTSPPPTPAVATYDFEDATTQGWYGRGATVTVVSDTVHMGGYALQVTGRTDGWNGPAVNVLSLLEVGATYEISGCIRLAAGTPAARTNFALEYTPVGGSTAYPWLGVENNTTDADWACMSGSFEYTEEAETLNLYAESSDATASFYIDDIAIVMTSPPPPTALFIYDFEDNTTQDWYGRGATVTVVTDTVHTGDYALQVTGRTDGWNGPALNVLTLLEVGATYQITGCIRLAEGLGPFRTNFALEYTVGGSSSYPWLGSDSNTTSDAWSCVTGSFKYTDAADALTLYAECSDATASFYIDDVIIVMTEPPSTEPPPPIQDIPSVYEFHEDDFLVGAALEPTQLTSDRHVELFTKHFNSLTAENAMKPGSIQPEEGVFNWTGADALADFARANNVAIHGHTLVWHQQAAEWMFENAAGEPLTPTLENKQLVLDRLEDHIVAVVNRYEDVVNVWDVVNEVIDASQDDCLRRSRWYELTGSDYISTAFTIAHREAPTATLILNDYGETDPAKRQCMYDVVQDLQDQGVPVHGIGMQMHINIQNPPLSAIDQTIAMFAELGQVHITELDMSIYTNDVDSYDEVPEEVLIKQGYRYKDIFEIFRSHAADIGSVTFWGLADDHTWLSSFPIDRINLPLLFDEELQAKWAYWGIIDPSQLPVLIKEQLVSEATPVVDGMTETLWEMLPWIDIGSTGTMTASFQTRWDDADNLYLIVKVEDPTEDAGDKVEVFIDQNNGKTATYEGDDRYYTFPSETFLGMNFVIMTDTQGYVLEARLPLTATLAPGTRLGFDVRVTDGSDDSVLSWNDPTHSQLTNPSQFGTLVLIDEIKLTTAIEGTPVIDGYADSLWNDAMEIETNVWVQGTSGATAKVKTMWDENHLYVYAVVSDTLLSKVSDNPWEEDSIEVFVDQNNAKTTSYEADDGQYRVNFDNEQSFGGAASADTLTSATRVIAGTPATLLIDGAYIVEAAITLTEVMPQPGLFIGFDFQVNNDENGDGARDSVAIWNDPTGQSYQNTSRLGVLQFVERPAHMIYLPLILRAYTP